MAQKPAIICIIWLTGAQWKEQGLFYIDMEVICFTHLPFP